MTNHDPGPVAPESTIAMRDILRLLLICLLAGAIGGLIARFLAGVIMFVLLTLATVGVPLQVVVGLRELLLVCLVVSALVGGGVGLLLGELVRILLCGPVTRLSSLPRFRVLLTTPLWPLIALGGFFWFDDALWSMPPILPLLLWPLGGMVLHVLAVAIALRCQMRTPAAATAAVEERTGP